MYTVVILVWRAAQWLNQKTRPYTKFVFIFSALTGLEERNKYNLKVTKTEEPNSYKKPYVFS